MAFSFLTSVSKAATGSGGTGSTSAIDTTGASLLVAASGFLSSGASATALPTIADSQGNIWVPYVVRGQVTAANTGAIVIYLCFNPTTNASHTFSATNGFSSIAVGAYSGADVNFPFGVWNSNAHATTTSLGTGSITPPTDNCLVIAALGYRQTTSVSIDSGFTIREQKAFIAGTSIGVVLADLIQTSAAAENPTFSWSGSSSFASTGIMCVRQSTSLNVNAGGYAF
jgi:hypothetical protein